MLIDLLSEDEINMITAMREQDTSLGSNYSCNNWVNTNKWLNYWETNKESFLAKPFIDNNSLILKKIYKNYVDENELKRAMTNFIFDRSFRDFQWEFYNALIKYNDSFLPIEDFLWRNLPLSNFLDTYIFNSETFLKNYYRGPDIEIYTSEDKSQKIEIIKGCKIIKVIGKIAKKLGLYDEWEEFRIQQSQILNQAKIDTTVCLSIHPLDYLTASLNNNNWRSCMHWEDGEYRRGVIEMMNSEYVIVAYFESNSEVVYPGDSDSNGTWNSKKWREFFIVNEDFISGIKGYPYWNKNIEKFVLNWLKELYTPYCEYPFSNEIIDNILNEDNFLEIQDSSINTSCKIHFDCGPAMYNDFYSSYDNYYSIILSTNPNFKELSKNPFDFFYSGPSECVCCGKAGDEYDFAETESLCCNDCHQVIYCCHCDEAIYDEENDLIYYHDRPYCAQCYDNLPICSFCDDELIDFDIDSDAFRFAVAAEDPDEENNYQEDKYIKSGFGYSSFGGIDTLYVCEKCVEKVFINGFNEIRSTHKLYKKTWNDIPMVYYKNIYPEAMKIFFNENYMDYQIK